MDMLEDDTATLAAMLQVDRQCFFAAVPRLYRDPFRRIRDIYRRRCHSIRLSAQRAQTNQLLGPPTTTTTTAATVSGTGRDMASGMIPLSMLMGMTEGSKETALKAWNAFRIKLFFEQDEAAINSRWKEEAQERERRLLMTLMSTLVQDLCLRFPDIAELFLPPATSASSSSSLTTSTPTPTWTGLAQDQTYDIRLLHCTLDFGPHFRKVTWTSQHYLKHWNVMDLEKLSTRRMPLPYTAYEAFANGDIKDKDGLFNYLFRHAKSVVALPEYLQRALLNGTTLAGIGGTGGDSAGSHSRDESGDWNGAGRIVALRIPIRRVRSFQDRHERAPRPRARKTESKTTARSAIPAIPEESEGANGTVTDASAATEAGPHIMDESLRPYCFKLDKLTHLRRIEICNLSQNEYDWETLRRAMLTIEFGSCRSGGGIAMELQQDLNITAAIEKRPSKIRELSLTTQATLGPAMDRILDCFGGLEVLEIMAPSFQYHPWVSNWNPRLCENLRVLKVGEVSRLTTSKDSLKDLGRFRRLEELRLGVDHDFGFQWVVDAKKEARTKAKVMVKDGSGMQGSLSTLPGCATAGSRSGLGKNNKNLMGLTEDDPLLQCLPRLKRLGIFNRHSLSLDIVAITTEAFADQLEELVLSFSGNEGPIHFTHPNLNITLPYLTRLAIRFTNLQRFRFENLAQQCPALEWIIIQHMQHSDSNSEYDSTAERRSDYDRLNNSIVLQLTQLTRLRTIFFEGYSTIHGEQLRSLVEGCLSLRRIGVHIMPAVTIEELAEMDTVLCSRPERFPLLQRGVYRLPSRMSSYMDHDFYWRITLFGYDLHE
ncbi:hypothetical protein EC991_007506 [Linnemannia zychae]|nr:hypothetical protein EC991_007506 [Linnemannia zychae]